MNVDPQVEELVRLLYHKFTPPIQVTYGTVHEIDKEEFHAILNLNMDEELKVWEVSMQSIIKCKEGLKMFPKTGSTVLMGRIGNSNQYYVAAYSELEKWLLEIEQQSLEVTAEGHVFNKGNNGGMVKIEELVNRLNAIEEAFNSLLNEYKSHVHNGGTIQGLTGNLTPPSTQEDIEKTQRDPLEDKKVKH